MLSWYPTGVSPISYMYEWIYWSVPRNWCKCLLVVYAFFPWEASYYESFLVSFSATICYIIYCRSIWNTLWNSLQVLEPHPRHHPSWSIGTLWSQSPSLSSWLLLHRWKVLHQWCNSIVPHNYTVSKTSFFLWSYRHIILHLVLFIELSSLLLWNKSHPSFIVGDYTWSFLQVKCISCMVRNIS